MRITKEYSEAGRGRCGHVITNESFGFIPRRTGLRTASNFVTIGLVMVGLCKPLLRLSFYSKYIRYYHILRQMW